MKKFLIMLVIASFSLIPIMEASATTKEIICSPMTNYCLGWDNHQMWIFDTGNNTLATMNFNTCSQGQIMTYQSSNSTAVTIASTISDTNTAQIGDAGHGKSIFSSRQNAT
jgi:hypothetical protein